MLMIATAIPAVASMTNNGITSMGINSNLQPSGKIIQPTSGGNVIFSQMPYLPNESWAAYTSAKNLAWLCQEDFWGINNVTIDDVHWWGLTWIWNSGWYQGVPDGMTFDIIFYQNNAGAPGAVVPPSPFYNVVPTYTNTGLLYNGWPMYYFEATIPSVYLTNGWLSIQSNASQNLSSFLWMTSPQGNLNALQNGASLAHNLAFNLTYTPKPDYQINITGGIGVKAVITNIGDADATGVAWQLQVKGGILGLVNTTANGTIDIPMGEPKTVSTGLFLGLGPISITARVSDKEKTATGKILLFYVLGVT